MKIHVFGSDFIRTGTITSYISLIWEERYSHRGYFQLVAVDTPENIRMLQVDSRLWQNGKRTSMIIKHVKQDSSTRQIIANGYTAVDRLRNRVFANTIRFNNIEAGIRSMISNNTTGDRSLSRFVLAPSAGFHQSHQTEMTGYELLEAAHILALEGQLGFVCEFDHRNRRDVFAIYQGENKTVGSGVAAPVLFKDDFGNLPNMRIVDDKSLFKNFAYVAGTGEADQRIVITVGTATGDARYEHYVDARDVQPDREAGETASSPSYLNRLRGRGMERLSERVRARSFTAEVRAPQFGDTVLLGDLVTCISRRYNVRLNTRILGFREITENNAMRRELVFGNAEFTWLQVNSMNMR